MSASTAQPDINNLSLRAEPLVIEGHVNSEDFFKPQLPDDGVHQVILKLGDRGVERKRQKDKATGQPTGNEFIEVNLVCQILDPETGEPGQVVFDNPNSIIMSSKGMSRLYAILDLAGCAPSEDAMTLSQLEDHVKIALAQSPRVGIATEWQARLERDGGKWETVKAGQKNFPPLLDQETGEPTGKFDTEVKDPKTGQTAQARCQITRYLRPQG